ncbi:H-2 class II histocompatibility antigen gamma chain [Liparis tanakae]|uniref:H-2 class II histocompatibility antigen gamma chain n=1 Tax=Liparis tanakae TaxID=230148 RepID=A0A4Z2HGW6_9TELE|nr:H-2 class II histocompatibility antigen gamma chain [Liparis tanakae]
MADSAEDAPLARGSLAGSEEVLLAPAGPTGGSNRYAFKVAGLTTIACLLLASQVFTAYMVFDQNQEIHSLQRNVERLDKQLTDSSQAQRKMRIPIKSVPLLMDLTLDEAAMTPLKKRQDTVVSVKTQLKDLMQDSQLPQFNETFLANLQSLKQQVNESEWKTKCQTHALTGTIGFYKPQCDEQGDYKPVQCWSPTGYCWCVDLTGTPIEGTRMRGRPYCQTAQPSRSVPPPTPLFGDDDY